MKEFDYLVDHALKNVWCAPGQDTQVMLAPARLTRMHGVSKTMRVGGQRLVLPDDTSRWHVYQIGALHPLLLKLFSKCFSWVSLTEASNRSSLFSNLYTTEGIEFPRYNTFYQYTVDDNLLVAVKLDPKIPSDLNVFDACFRVYSNAFYQTSGRPAGPGPYVYTNGATIESGAVKATLKAEYLSYAVQDGKTWLWVNGRTVSEWDDSKIAVGDVVEFIWDASVYKVLDFKVGDLAIFNSHMDKSLKYLLHYEGASDLNIDYNDDIDVHIWKKETSGLSTGVYYVRNQEESMRNLTHRDWSIQTVPVKRLSQTLERLLSIDLIETNDLHVEVCLRRSGYDRPLVFEASRIHELYKMQDADIRRAMTGLDANIPVWFAPNLEAAAYPLVMREQCCNIDNAMVENAYGYNGASKVLADTPSAVYDDNGEMVVDVPYKLQFGATAYEYNAAGDFLGWFVHIVGPRYKAQSPVCAYVELIAGYGSTALREWYNQSTIQLNPKNSHRVFMCRRIAGVPDNKWQDVTVSGKDTLYSISPTGAYQWLDTSVTSYNMVRSDQRFYARDYKARVQGTGLTLTLINKRLDLHNAPDQAMQIPLGQIDVIMNGKSLIRGLDYFVDFPKVVITNKKFLVRPLDTQEQEVHIRMTGFASASFELVDEGDLGFVEHGVLSNNSRFDIRDDKVLRIVVGGQLKTRDDFEFSELHSGVSILDPNNGLPYMVKPLLIPVRSHVTNDTYEIWEKAEAVDKMVSDYLTSKIPQPPRPAPSAVPDRWQLVSPFVAQIVMDLKDGRLQIPAKATGVTRQEMIDIVMPYEKWLKVCPSQTLGGQDVRYVVIHPHGYDSIISLTSFQYQFVHQVILNYCNDAVLLSGFIQINPI